MRALIIGAGIAGLTAALELRRQGFSVVVAERAKSLRAEGYLIDFFGPGYDAAERLGLLPALAEIHFTIPRLTFLQCLSLLAGQGASLAMAGAYFLAGALGRSRSHVQAAFEHYQSWIQPMAAAKQRGGRRMARWFVPESQLGVNLRDMLTRTITWPGVELLVRRWLVVEDRLPDLPPGAQRAQSPSRQTSPVGQL